MIKIKMIVPTGINMIHSFLAWRGEVNSASLWLRPLPFLAFDQIGEPE